MKIQFGIKDARGRELHLETGNYLFPRVEKTKNPLTGLSSTKITVRKEEILPYGNPILTIIMRRETAHLVEKDSKKSSEKLIRK